MTINVMFVLLDGRGSVWCCNLANCRYEELYANMMWKWETSYDSQENARTEWACELFSDQRCFGKVSLSRVLVYSSTVMNLDKQLLSVS